MAGAVLRLLQNRRHAQRLDHGHHLLGLMAYDNNRFPRLQWRASVYHLLDQRSPSRAMEHFGGAGFQPRTFSRGQDHDGEVIVGHKFSAHSA
jgi:hypothetical protein